MQHRIALWTLLLLALLLGSWATPAAAGLDTWHFGGGFNVGGIFFRVGYAEAGPFGSSFSFEAAKPFSYRGYGCSSYCYRQGPRFYHHPTCSAVHRHFGHYGYSPGYFIQHYGPPGHYRRHSHYYAPPRWNVHYYGSPYRHDRWDRRGYSPRKHGHHKHKFDRGRRDRYRHDTYRDHRQRDDHDRRDRGRHDRDRHNRGRFDRD